jgi:hypothetical protein
VEHSPAEWRDKIAEAAQRHGFDQPPPVLNEMRLMRAKDFAAKVMLIVEPYCDDKQGAATALLAAAYDADARIISKSEDGRLPD